MNEDLLMMEDKMSHSPEPSEAPIAHMGYNYGFNEYIIV
jgi:hypothetical protein